MTRVWQETRDTIRETHVMESCWGSPYTKQTGVIYLTPLRTGLPTRDESE